jgi:DNA polymerase III sliding clamp (beta) subunit (PCNA family)
MKMFGSVKDVGMVFKAVRMKDAVANWPVYLFSYGKGMDIRSMDPSRVSLFTVSVPVGATNVELSDVPSQGTVYSIPYKFLLTPLAYFSDNEGLSLMFQDENMEMKVGNYRRTVNYVVGDSPPKHPTLPSVSIQKALVDADDLVRAINLTKDVGASVKFKLGKSGFSIEGGSAEVGVASGYQVAPEQMTLEEVSRTVESSFDPSYLLEALAFADNKVEISMGDEYPIIFRGRLKNGLQFVNYIAPRMEHGESVEAKNG